MPPNVVVDLTGSDEEPETIRRQRRRPEDDSNDCDVVMVSATTGNAKRRKTEGLPSNGLQIRGNEDAGANADEDFEIIGGDVGQVALRDLPHLRPDCVDHKMSTGNSAANMEHCPQCYCYVCDVKVSSCTMWGNGSADRDHCNACKSFSWDRLRNLARIGKMALVQRRTHQLE